MFKVPKFTIDEIVQQLVILGIPFSCSGRSRHQCYSFKSLRNVEDRGIYYVDPNIMIPPVIRDSIILNKETVFSGPDNVIISVEHPQIAFYQLMEAMLSEKNSSTGIHPTAIVDDTSQVDTSAYIGPYCNLVNCIVKAGVKLYSHVTVMSGTIIEENVKVEPHSTIGATGVAWVWDDKMHRRVIQPQVGYTIIGKGSFLGSDVTVVRGSVNESTIVGKGCVIAHGSKIGHGSQIGDECHFANNVSIAGNVTLGRRCFLGSGAVVRPQTRLAEQTIVGAGAVVVKHCDQPEQILMGNPAKTGKKKSGKLSGVPDANKVQNDH